MKNSKYGIEDVVELVDKNKRFFFIGEVVKPLIEVNKYTEETKHSLWSNIMFDHYVQESRRKTFHTRICISKEEQRTIDDLGSDSYHCLSHYCMDLY